MADCYANENFPLPVVDALRELGHNLLTTYEIGKADQAIGFTKKSETSMLTQED